MVKSGNCGCCDCCGDCFCFFIYMEIRVLPFVFCLPRILVHYHTVCVLLSFLPLSDVLSRFLFTQATEKSSHNISCQIAAYRRRLFDSRLEMKHNDFFRIKLGPSFWLIILDGRRAIVELCICLPQNLPKRVSFDWFASWIRIVRESFRQVSLAIIQWKRTTRILEVAC